MRGKRCSFLSFIANCLSVFGLLFLAVPAHGQSTTDGAISGTVTDASGAAVAGARVAVKNNGTNLEQTAVTDDSGYFRVIKLQPATYTVSIEASGFGGFKAEKVIVAVGSVTDLPARLQVASSGTQVVVTAELPTVNTTSPEFAPILDQVAISNLPINGNRWSNFALLTPTVVNNGSGFGLISVRAMSVLLNNNTVDGADNNQAFFSEERGRTRAGYSTAKAAVQEFQVNTSNYSAEYGRAAGAVINTVTKSGTNQFHGEAYFYDRNQDWGATNPFTRITTQENGQFVSNPYKPKDVRKIWGGGVGGPILKDRLFFNFAFDRFTRDFPGTAVPGSPAQFFAQPVPDLNGFGTCSSLNAAAFQPLDNGANIRTATQGACTLLANLALPDYATAAQRYNDGLAGLLAELGPVPRKGEQTIYFPKLDWHINSKNFASFEANRMRWASPAGIQTQATNTFGIASFGNDAVQTTWGVAKLYTFLTSNLSNEARFQYGRDFEFQFAQPPTAYEQANFVTSPNFPGYTNPLGLPPDVFITGGFDMGVPTFLQRTKFPDERTAQFADTVSWIRGRHSLKFGMDFRHVNDTAQNLRFQFGSFSYSNIGNYLSDLNSPNKCGTSHNLGCYTSYNQAFGTLAFQFNTQDWAFFAEDSWRIKPRLTLMLGLRYEYEKLPDPFSNIVNPSIPQTGKMPSDTNNIGPRVGFAWDVFGNGKTAVRGGYGLYYARIINSAIYNALITTGQATGQLQYAINPATPTGAPTPGAPSFPQILNAPAGTARPNAVFFDPNFQAPQVQQVDLTIERQLPWNTLFSISYLGGLGRSLPDFVDTNLDSHTVTTDPTSPAKSITYTIFDPNHSGPLANNSTYTTTLFNMRPNGAFGAMTNVFSGVSSNYHALSAQLNKRMSQHVQFMFSYTFAKALDFGQNEATFTDTNDLLTPGNIRAEYGPSIYNVPHRFVLSAIVQAPWKAGGWFGYLANGWQIAPIYQAQSGLPYSLATTGNAPGSAPAGGGTNGSNGRKGLDVFGRNSFTLPRTQVVDLRLSKSFTFAEHYNFEVLGEAFNLFNHVNVTSVSITAYNVTTSGGTVLTTDGPITCATATPCLSFQAPFGTVSNANSNFAYSSRQVQIGVRFKF